MSHIFILRSSRVGGAGGVHCLHGEWVVFDPAWRIW